MTNLPGGIRPAKRGRMPRIPDVLYQLAIVLLLIALIVVVPGRYCRWKAVQLAEEQRPVVQAICNYQAETGLLPYTLEDVQARFPVVVSEGVFWSGSDLYIRQGVPNVYCDFQEGEQHWSCSFGRLSVPQVTPTVTPVTGQKRVEAALAEYDRRINAYADKYDNLRQRTAKMALLFAQGRNADIYTECLTALQAYPDWWRAQLAAAMFAPEPRKAEQEAQLRAWVERSPGFLHAWYLAKYYREQGDHPKALEALRAGAEYPLTKLDDDEPWVSHAYAFDAASYACQQAAPKVTLAICDSWSRPEGVYNYPSDDLPAFQAAALLQLGQFAEAKTAVLKAIARSKEHRLWAGNLDQLHDAIKRGDRAFIYNPGQPYPGFNQWPLFPPPEFEVDQPTGAENAMR